MGRAETGVCVGSEWGAVAFIDGDSRQMIYSQVESVGGVVGDDRGEVILVRALEICCVGVVSDKAVE